MTPAGVVVAAPNLPREQEPAARRAGVGDPDVAASVLAEFTGCPEATEQGCEADLTKQDTPALRLLSLGAGVQSTTLLLLAAEGRLPRIDGAVFSDTGWEPRAVYEHLNRLEREVAEPAGIPIYRVSGGNIRDDALDPEHRFASMPLHVLGPCQVCTGHKDDAPGHVEDLTGEVDGQAYERYSGVCPRCKGSGKQEGLSRRQCTSEYKLKPIKRQVRRLLGYPHPTRVPRGVFAEQWIGISRDEFHRAKDSGIRYLCSVFPLLYLGGAADGREGWTRDDCARYLRSRGWESTPKSACVGCPFSGNSRWRLLRDHFPDEWADAVEFDHAIRTGNARGTAMGHSLRGEAFLHRSKKPLDQAPIDRVTAHEWSERQTDVFGQVADAELDEDPEGCSPWTCRAEDHLDDGLAA